MLFEDFDSTESVPFKYNGAFRGLTRRGKWRKLKAGKTYWVKRSNIESTSAKQILVYEDKALTKPIEWFDIDYFIQ